MAFENKAPFCTRCDGLGQKSQDSDSVDFWPISKWCCACKGTGFDLDKHNPGHHYGELVNVEHSAGKLHIGFFLKELNHYESQVLVGKRLITISNDAITFVELKHATEEHALENREYKSLIYAAIGIEEEEH